MDEPSAALTADEGARLFEIVRGLKRQGTTIVYTSHFLDEVLSLVDTVTVLKDGKLVRTSPAAVETPDRLVAAMLGRSLELAFPKRASGAEAPVGALGAGTCPRRRHPRRLARGPCRRDRGAGRADRLGALGGGAGNLRRGSNEMRATSSSTVAA